MAGNRGCLRRDVHRLGPKHLVPPTRNRIIGRRRKAEQHVPRRGGAGNLQINQSSQNAIINWADFSIDAGELAQFNQPGASAAVLNRVTGGSASEIHGALKANGKNPFLGLVD